MTNKINESVFLKFIYWVVGILGLLTPIVIKWMLYPNFGWTISLLFPIMILLMYPLWRWGILALLTVSAVKFTVEYQLQSDIFFDKLPELISNSIMNWVLFFSISFFFFYFLRLSEQLRESEERYRKVVEYSPKGIIIHQDRKILFANPSALKILKETNVVGKSICSYIHSDYQKISEQIISKAIEGEELPFIETEIVQSDGTIVIAEFFSVSIDFDGQSAILSMFRDITERKVYEEKLSYMAYHDTLTGLSNRRLFKKRFEQALKEAKRYKRKMGIIYMDIDKFKEINDTLGHDVGDELLVQFTRRVQSCLRESDTFSRLGGDEFNILLPDIQKAEDAYATAIRILSLLQEPWHIGEHSFYTSSSIGVSFYPKDGVTIDDLLKCADLALYEAKQSGRNNIKIYHPSGKCHSVDKLSS